LTLSAAEYAFVQTQSVAHLATADANGRPHVVPVCFAYLDGRFYIAIDEKPKRTTRLKRLRNIDENPAVALVFDRYDDDWSRLGWVMVQGTASVIVGGTEHERAVAALRRGTSSTARCPSRASGQRRRPVISVAVEKVVSWGVELAAEEVCSIRTQVSGWKSTRLWVLSQKGLISEWPQRQRVNQSPGGISNSTPSWSEPCRAVDAVGAVASNKDRDLVRRPLIVRVHSGLMIARGHRHQ
jgi:PPOX class probable F420-dependent enzyme